MNSSRISGGDRIFLRRGFHGSIVATTKNTSQVQVLADAGHTPLLRSLALVGATNWLFSGLTITPMSGAGNSGGVSVDEFSTGNTVENCYLYSAQDISKWNYNASAGIKVLGSRNTFRGNHLFYAGGIFIDYGANNNYFGYNTNENFASDGIHIRGGGTVVEHNLIMNAHKVNGNHNDLCQAYTSGGIFRFNELRAYSDLNQKFLARDVQGFGMYDGIIKNWVIEGNLIRVDHPIGIWTLGAEGFTIKDNKVVRCTSPMMRTPPSIAVKESKGGRPSKNNTVTGNSAEAFIWNATRGYSVGSVSNNSVSKSQAASNDTSAPSAPARVTAAVVPGYGVDLRWTASGDNVKVVGYEVFRDGLRIGRTRVGTNFFALTSNTSGSFQVRAFDYKENKSAFTNSTPENGTNPPEPEVDTTKPSIPGNATALAQSSSAILVSWAASSDNVGVVAYDVFSGASRVGSTAGTSLSLSGLAASTTYSFTVKARDAAGNASDASSVATATTLPGNITLEDTQKPTMPGSVRAAAQSSSAIQVSWTASTDNRGVTGYDVYQGTTKVTTVTVTSIIINSLAPNTGYNFKVQARDAAGNLSDFSAVASATTQPSVVMPPPPPASGVVYEAENAVVRGAVKYETHVDYIHATGDYIEWTVNAPVAGRYILEFKYGLSSGNRPLQVNINGAVAVASLSFPYTGSVAHYKTVSTEVSLVRGSNKVRATAIGLSGANMDSLKVSPKAP